MAAPSPRLLSQFSSVAAAAQYQGSQQSEVDHEAPSLGRVSDVSVVTPPEKLPSDVFNQELESKKRSRDEDGNEGAASSSSKRQCGSTAAEAM